MTDIIMLPLLQITEVSLSRSHSATSFVCHLLSSPDISPSIHVSTRDRLGKASGSISYQLLSWNDLRDVCMGVYVCVYLLVCIDFGILGTALLAPGTL